MDRRIASASISVGDGLSAVKLQLSPGINILWGENAEEVMWTLVGIFGATPGQISAQLKAEIRWQNDISFWISGEINAGRSAIFVEDTTLPNGTSAAQQVKRFHKRRFLEFRKQPCVFDGTRPFQRYPLGESDLILNNFHLFLCCNLSDDRPLFLFNFLERLDESIDLSPIFRALAATGRQVFIAVPRSYTINTLEEMPYDATIHTL